MSEANVEIVRTAMEDFIAGKTEFDADGALTRMAGEEHWHPDIELDVSEAVVPEMRGVFRGKEAVRRWWGEWLGAWETVEFEYELLGAGNRVVALIDQRMRGRSTGIEVSRGKYAQVGTYRDGLMVHWRFYGDQADALKAVGLAEEAISQRNVEVVRAGATLLNEGNFDALFASYHDDVEFCDLRSAVDTPQVLRGVEAVKALLLGWSEAWDDFGSEVYEYIDAEPYVVCDTRWYGTGRESTIPIDIRQVDVFELRDGKIIRVTLGYATKAEALEAVGLAG